MQPVVNPYFTPPQTVGKPLFFCADLMIMGSNKPLYAHFDFYMKKDN